MVLVIGLNLMHPSWLELDPCISMQEEVASH